MTGERGNAGRWIHSDTHSSSPVRLKMLMVVVARVATVEVLVCDGDGGDGGGDGDHGRQIHSNIDSLTQAVHLGILLRTRRPVFFSPLYLCETPCPLFRYPSIKSESLAQLGPGRLLADGPRWDCRSNTVTHASLRACGAQLGGSVWKQGK